MKNIYTCLLLLLVPFLSKAESIFSPGGKYIIACYDTKFGGIEPGEQYPLIYNESGTLQNDKVLWIITEEAVDKYSLKNAATGQYMEYAPTDYDSRYMKMSNQLNGDYSLFTFEFRKSENNIAYWAVKPVLNSNVRLDKRSSGVVGPYEISLDANNRLFSFQEKAGTYIQAPKITIETPYAYFKSFTLNEKALVLDKRENKYYYSLPLDEMNTNVTRTIHFIPKKDSYTIKIGGQEITNASDFTFKNVIANKEFSIQIYEAGKLIHTEKLIFTGLPIVQLYSIGSSLSSTFSQGKFRIYENEEEYSGELLNAEMRYRGASALGYNKKSFAVKLKDENWESANRSFFGLRNDNYWILDAMAFDKSRMRNRIATDLWNDFSTDPYFKASEPNMVNATRGHYVEMFLDDEYWGLYCMTERIDRKQLKLKKYQPETETIRGVLYKTTGWSYEVLMGYPYMWKPEGSPVTSFSNTYETWSAHEVKYPDLEDGEKIDWEPIYDVVDLVATGNDYTFKKYVKSNFDLPVWLDYYLMMELILATDNHGKNTYYYMYNIQNETKLGIAPWDMDGVFGVQWAGKRIAAEQDYTQYIIANEHGEHNLFRRLKAKNIESFNDNLKIRYDQLRFSHFSAKSLLNRFQTYMNMFEKSGASVREIERWDEENKVALDFEEEMDYITDWIYSRTDYLNNVYGPYVPPVGIDKVETNYLSVYPNPVIETLYINDVQAGTPIWIYSETGICLYHDIIPNSSYAIDFSKYPTGRYFLKAGEIGKVIIKK